MNNFSKEKIFYTKGKPPVEGKKLRNIILIALLAILVFAVASTCWYTVDEKEQAVVTTFGKVTDTVTDAGMHFKLPLGIQKVQKVAVNVYQKIELGYRSDAAAASSQSNIEVIEKESKMITGDFNIVNVDFFIEYKISDPEKYLYNSGNPEEILKNLIQSQIRAVVGSSTVDGVLTDGKSEIQSRVKKLVLDTLAEYDIGLTLTDIKIQDAEPPTTEVIEAFKAVESAKQGKETAINQAAAYKETKEREAQAEANRLTENAEFLKTDRINEAKQKVAMFNATYAEYTRNPEVTRIRMYYEMISKTLPGVKLYIDVSDTSTEKLLPLDEFASVN